MRSTFEWEINRRRLHKSPNARTEKDFRGNVGKRLGTRASCPCCRGHRDSTGLFEIRILIRIELRIRDVLETLGIKWRRRWRRRRGQVGWSFDEHGETEQVRRRTTWWKAKRGGRTVRCLKTTAYLRGQTGRSDVLLVVSGRQRQVVV